MHREDIKAALRKKHGTLLSFEQARGLPSGSVKDVLRGRGVAQTEQAIATELGKPIHVVFPHRAAESSTKGDATAPGADAHRLIGEER